VNDDPFISDQEIQKALDWLRDNAEAIGKAKARTVRAGHMLKHIEALESKASDERAADSRKMEARTTQRYLKAIEEDAAAAGAYEEMRASREAAAHKIECWRTTSANYRSMKI